MAEFPTAPNADILLTWFEADGGRGYVTALGVGDRTKRLRWQDLQWEYGAVSVEVVGVKPRLKELRRSDFDPGREVSLRLEPDNPVDAKAVAVWNKQGKVQVGYLPADLPHKEEIFDRLSQGKPLRTFVMWERCRESEREGLRLLVVTPGTALRLE